MKPLITGLSMKFNLSQFCVNDEEEPEEDTLSDVEVLYELELFSSVPLMYKAPTPHPNDTYLKYKDGVNVR